MLALPIGEWSLKVSDGWPDDPRPRTSPVPAWAGVVPLATALRRATAGARPARGIPSPPSVQGLTATAPAAYGR